jgi:hypothetical protein
MKHIVTMDHHGQDFVISSYSRTAPGYWVPNGTLMRVPDRASDTLVSRSVRHALAASHEGVPMPKRMAPDPLEGVIHDKGVPSRDEYVAESTSIDIATDDNDHVVITPKKHDSSRHHMVEMTDRARTLEHPDEATLATTLRACLDESE